MVGKSASSVQTNCEEQRLIYNILNDIHDLAGPQKRSAESQSDRITRITLRKSLYSDLVRAIELKIKLLESIPIFKVNPSAKPRPKINNQEQTCIPEVEKMIRYIHIDIEDLAAPRTAKEPLSDRVKRIRLRKSLYPAYCQAIELKNKLIDTNIWVNLGVASTIFAPEQTEKELPLNLLPE